jgi:hypothetical protein
MSEETILQETETVVFEPVQEKIGVNPKCEFDPDPCELAGNGTIPSPICVTCQRNPGYIGGKCQDR